MLKHYLCVPLPLDNKSDVKFRKYKGPLMYTVNYVFISQRARAGLDGIIPEDL